MRKLQRFYPVLLSFVATTIFLPIFVQAASFKDVAENTEYYSAIEYLKTKNVVSGYPDGTFQPQQSINRAEALKILLLAIKASLDSKTTLVFPDVDPKDWFYGYVAKGFESKIVEGYPDKKFRPENNINLAESLKIIALSFNLPLPAKPLSSSPFPDVPVDIWYSTYVKYAKDKQFIAARDDGLLHAERYPSRGEFSEIIYRLLYTREKKLEIFPLSTNWPVFTHPTDHYALSYPFDWIKIAAGNQTIFWKQDKKLEQISFARIFPNSATVVVAVEQNPQKLNLDKYLAKLQYDTGAVIQKSRLNEYPLTSIAIPASGLKDFYFELPNKTILIIYSQIGTGPLRSKLEEEILNLVNSVRYNETESKVDKETFLSDIRQNLLVPEKGKSTLKRFIDVVVIETDTIGIGTGPVDYYYSAQYDVTMKYERRSDVLLAMKTGRVTTF